LKKNCESESSKKVDRKRLKEKKRVKRIKSAKGKKRVKIKKSVKGKKRVRKTKKQVSFYAKASDVKSATKRHVLILMN
jgi:hypothetical protein